MNFYATHSDEKHAGLLLMDRDRTSFNSELFTIHNNFPVLLQILQYTEDSS